MGIDEQGQERGSATVLDRKGKFRIFQQLVSEDDELSHEGRGGEFFSFATREETEVKRSKDRVVAGGDERSLAEYMKRLQPAGNITLELVPAGDRHHSVREIRLEGGIRALGLTDGKFEILDPAKQSNGKVTGVYTLDVKYADLPGTEAGPKSLNHTYKEEWKHAVPYDRWYKQALDTVKAMNRDLHFDSPAQAARALEGQLREKFNQAKAESLELHSNRLLKDTHNSPFNYEE